MNNHPTPANIKATASKMWKSGMPTKAICEQTGLSRNTLAGMAYRNRDLFPARGSPLKSLFSAATCDGDPVALASGMWNIGATLEEIRGAIGVTQGALNEAIRRHPDIFPPRVSGKSIPDRVIVSLPPLESVSAPIVREYVPRVRLPPVIPTSVDIDLAPVVFRPRRPRQCLWPLWDNGRPTHVYCGGAASEGRPYCETHHKIAHARS